jgi:hypothetical protein
MGSENLNQYQDENYEVVQGRIQLSRNKKWIIIRPYIEGRKVKMILSVTLFEKIIERARAKTPYIIEEIKD